MLVLALDTATTAMTAGLVELDTTGAVTTLAVRAGAGSRHHAEALTPWVAAVLAEVGVGVGDLDAIVCGTGPGPFTGLRVGMVTAAALGDALARPVHGVLTHDALAHDALAPGGPAGSDGAVLAVTDARRREVYWAVSAPGPAAPGPAGAPTDGGPVPPPRRTHGPAVSAPADLAADLAADPSLAGVRVAVGDAADVLAGLVATLCAAGPAGPTPGALVAVAAADLRAGAVPAPLVPHYLRRPDAVPPGAPKAVSRP